MLAKIKNSNILSCFQTFMRFKAYDDYDGRGFSGAAATKTIVRQVRKYETRRFRIFSLPVPTFNIPSG